MHRLSRGMWCGLTALLLTACSRTAREAAIQVSALPIPEHAKVLRFVDSAGGMVGEDLTLLIELELTPSGFAYVEADARAKGYLAVHRPLRDDSIPVDFIDGVPNAPNGFGTAVRELRPGDSGWFLGKGNAGSGSIVTLDPARRRLVITAWIL